MAGLTNFGSIAAALRQRNFAYYMWGGAPSLVGYWVHRMAVLWLTWELTHSGTWLGLISVADLAPTVFVTPFAGAIADRVDRRKMAIITQILAMIQAILLAILYMTGQLDIWSLWIFTLCLGVVYAFFTAARLSLVPNLLPPENVPSAIAFDSAVFNIARFLGPLIAGLIIERWGVGPAFLLNAATFVVYLVALYQIRPLRSEVSDRSAGSLLSDTREGILYAVNHPGIRPILFLLIAMAVSVKAVLDLLPGFADAVFHRGPGGLAELAAAAGLGAFIGAIYLAQRGSSKGLTLLTMSSLLIGGGGVLLLCSTDSYWVALIAMFFAGLSVTLSGTGAQVLMQGVVDGAMRGRVMSLYGVIYRGGPAAGALVMGSASDVIGLQAAVAGGGVLVLLVSLWIIRGHRVTAQALEKVPVRS